MGPEILDALALCRVKSLNWHLIAREASRPDGVARMLRGEIAESSKVADEARELLPVAPTDLDRNRGDVRALGEPILERRGERGQR